MLHNSFREEIFPNVQSKPPLMQLDAMSSLPIASYLEEVALLQPGLPWQASCLAAISSAEDLAMGCR